MHFHIFTSSYSSFSAPQSPLFCTFIPPPPEMYERINRSHPLGAGRLFFFDVSVGNIFSRLNPVPLLRHTEFHLYSCNFLCFRRVRTCGLIYVLRVLSAVFHMVYGTIH